MIEPIQFLNVKEVPKGWGSETHIINTDQYCLKFLNFKKGKKFSAHFHYAKTETWYLLSGFMTLHYWGLCNADRLSTTFLPGMVIHIPAGNPHQLEALEDSVIVEVSTRDSAEDNYRIEKGDSQS